MHPPSPPQLLDYVEREFRRIKRKQAELLGERGLRSRGAREGGLPGGGVLQQAEPPRAKL